MATTRTVTEYEKEDIEKLNEMTKDEIIQILEDINRGWLPPNYVYAPEEFETYTENQYQATRLHRGISNAIKMLHDLNERR